ncbi:MAG: AAA family ATPase [Treponema sp.]|nr:AAA family ATPase [Treponema sp.]
MCILGIEIIEGDKYVLKKLKKGWYPFFHCDELRTPPKNKREIKLPLTDTFYSFEENLTTKIQISCVLGKNGSGKSTLFEILYRVMNNVAYYLNKLPHDLKYANGINACLYYENDGHIGYIHVCSSKKDCILFAGEKTSKKFKELVDSELTILEKLFYVIVTNYSIYSFNPDDYYLDDGNENYYLKDIFYKNDGYITPLVVLPFRDEYGIIDVFNERQLAEQRISALSIFLYLNYHNCLVDGKRPKKLNYILQRDAGKIYSSKIKDEGSFNILKQTWSEYLKYNNLKLADAEVQNAAVNYLAYKSVKIKEKYPLSFENLDFSIFNMDSTDPMNFIKSLLEDNSHITLKVRQTIEFFKNPYEELKEGNIEINKKQFSDNLKTVDDYFLRLPPPFYHSDLFFEENEIPEHSLSNMSSGEKQLFYSLSYVLYHLKNLDCDKNSADEECKYPLYKNAILVFDEVELYLHPEYQRKFLFRLLQAIQNCRLQYIEHIHIIIATHSPYVLSDIPVQNLLILDDGNISDEKLYKQCFCANIYDILNNQFFMNSPVGEFSQQKINEILECSEKKKELSKQKRDEYNTFISMIDEPFLRKTLEFALKKIEYKDFKNDSTVSR